MKRIFAAVMIGSMVACGGSSNPGTPSPVRELLGQGNFSLASLRDANANGLAFDSWRFEVTTRVAGTLEVQADWTFGTSVVGVGLERSPCSFQQFYAGQCSDVTNVGPPSPKPARLSAANLAAGTYVVFIANAGPNAESGNYQVYLTH
jgi:hypothetical protein